MRERTFFWGDLTSDSFRALDPERTIAVLPVAAVEQHGPHLPVVTDTAIADGMIATLRDLMPDTVSVAVMPTQAVGASDEHILSPGTLTLSPAGLLATLTEIGAGVARAGLRKLVLVSAHGGNSEVLGLVARALRVRHAMLCVATSWQRFGLPEGLYDPVEMRHGIHGGDIETSLMLHFRPELVRMERAETFISNAIPIEQEFSHLRATGPHGFGWLAQDLNTRGAVGDAASASAEKGRDTAEHQVRGFIALLEDMTAFSLNRLYTPEA